MTSRDHLRAAARCWERAGFYQEAADRFTQAEAWHDAGRCMSRAERHRDAALAYSRAGEPLLEAREHLMGNWTERAQALYRQIQARPSIWQETQVEALLGLCDLEGAIRAGIDTVDHHALTKLISCLCSRGRPDFGARFWSQVPNCCINSSGLHWNLGHARSSVLPKIGAPSPSATPSEFVTSGASLVPLWEQLTSQYIWGNRALHWSYDDQSFAVALDTEGLLRGRLSTGGVQVDLARFSEGALCLDFLPETQALLIGFGGGNVRFHSFDGKFRELIDLRLVKAVWDISFAPNGRRVAVSAATNPGAVLRVWTWKEDQPDRLAFDTTVSAEDCEPIAAWAPDGQRLAWSPGRKDFDDLYLLSAEATIRLPEVHSARIMSLAFSPDSSILVTGSMDRTISLRSCCDGSAIAGSVQFEGPVFGVAFHPKDSLLAIAEGKYIHLFRWCPGASFPLLPISKYGLPSIITGFSFSPLGSHVLVTTIEGPQKGRLHVLRMVLNS